MDHVLPLLIERATAARERQAATMRVAYRALEQAGATLGKLQDFRGECIARAPASTGQSTDAETLAAQQRFVTRLDDAIGQQSIEAQARAHRAAEQQSLLAQAQQRLLAFETLAKRRLEQKNAREHRRELRDGDEFAALAARRRKDNE